MATSVQIKSVADVRVGDVVQGLCGQPHEVAAITRECGRTTIYFADGSDLPARDIYRFTRIARKPR